LPERRSGCFAGFRRSAASVRAGFSASISASIGLMTFVGGVTKIRRSLPADGEIFFDLEIKLSEF